MNTGSPTKFHTEKISETDVAYEVKTGMIIEPTDLYEQCNSFASANWVWSNFLAPASVNSMQKRILYIQESPESIPDETREKSLQEWDATVRKLAATVPLSNQEAKKDDSQEAKKDDNATNFIENVTVGGGILGVPIAVQGCSEANIALALNCVPYLTENQYQTLAKQIFQGLQSNQGKALILLLSGGALGFFIVEKMNPKASFIDKLIGALVGVLAFMAVAGLVVLIANVVAPNKQKLEQNQQQKLVPELQEKSSPTRK